MNKLENKYLEQLIEKKLFKNFEDWNKDDFHFLLSLLNYPNYTNLALIILVNLRNWVLYSNGSFFYPIDHLQKILKKYYLNTDLYEEIKENENIKLNIKKKTDNLIDEEDSNELQDNDLFKYDYIDGVLNFGDILSIDTFKFFIWVILFFIIFSIINLYSYYNSINYTPRNIYNHEDLLNNSFNLKKFNIDDFLNVNNLHKENDNDEKNIFTKMSKDKNIFKDISIKNILNKVIDYVL